MAMMQQQQSSFAAPRSGRRPSRLWSGLHLLLRFAGLTGFLLACVGLVLVSIGGGLDSWNSFREVVFQGALGGNLVLCGGGLALLALLVELGVMLSLAAGRRSAVGANAFVQIGLAVILLVGVNVYSSGVSWLSLSPHYELCDLTRQQQFTLPKEIQQQFQSLKDNTTIVIYQRHRTFSSLTDKPDQYDAAAERKVVEKVKDLVQQLREQGARFNIVVLDSEAEDYHDKLKKLTAQAPALKSAIERAAENSLFFSAGDQVQQLSFNDFYRLDKTASREDNDNRGNLVLRAGGVEPIAHRILNLEQRKPRVGVLVVHEAFTTEGVRDEFTMAGTRKVLEANGFEVRDIVLKRWTGFRPEPTVDSLEDSKLLRLQDEVPALDSLLARRKQEIASLTELLKLSAKGTSQQLTEAFKVHARKKFPLPLVFFRLPVVLEPEDRDILQGWFKNRVASLQRRNEDDEQERTEMATELARINPERLSEKKHVTDISAQMRRALADCDLLLVDRSFIQPEGFAIADFRIHDLDESQVNAIKEFLQAGKPILACLGPENREDGNLDEPDELEKALSDLGVHFGKRPIIFDAQARMFGPQRGSLLRAAKQRQMPDLRLAGSSSNEEQRKRSFGRQYQKLGLLAGLAGGPLQALPFGVPEPETTRPSRSPNPIAESLRQTEVSADAKLHLFFAFPRLVYLQPELLRRLPYDPVLLSTDNTCWNDFRPVSFRGEAPEEQIFENPGDKDPDNGTPDEKRLGPFNLAVAFETKTPASWRSSAASSGASTPTPAKLPGEESVRVVAIGHPVFIGKNLSAGQERLLLDSCSWLLRRDDRLASSPTEWRYPRVDLDERSQAIWQWACRLGLPLLCAYLGFVVMLVRRLR